MKPGFNPVAIAIGVASSYIPGMIRAQAKYNIRLHSTDTVVADIIPIIILHVHPFPQCTVVQSKSILCDSFLILPNKFW